MKTYHKYCAFIALLLLALCMTSCDLTSGQRFTPGTVVITGMIYAGEYITHENAIYVGRSVEIDKISIDAFSAIFDSVFVRDIDLDSEEPLLSKKLTYTFTIANNRPKLGYYDPDNDFMITSGHKYKIVAYAGADSTWAETHVPEQFVFVSPTDTYVTDIDDISTVEMKHTEIDNRWPLKIDVGSTEARVIYMEYYCLLEFNDFEPKPYLVMGDYLGMDIPVDKAEDYDSFMDGYPRKNKYFDKLRPTDGSILTIPFNQFNYLFYAPYQTTIYVVDDNFYKYIYKNQGYLQGGVRNGGIGYFGSAYRQTLYTRIVK